MMQAEWRDESLAIAARLQAHADATGRPLIGLALAWLLANRLVTAPIVGPRTQEQMHTYLDAIGTPWTAEDEALVDGMVPRGHPSTPGYSDPAYPIEGPGHGLCRRLAGIDYPAGAHGRPGTRAGRPAAARGRTRPSFYRCAGRTASRPLALETCEERRQTPRIVTLSFHRCMPL